MSRAVDAITVADSISETIAKVCKPLKDDQRTVLVGALAVWLDKSRHAARKEALREAANELDKQIHDVTDPVEWLRAMADREDK